MGGGTLGAPLKSDFPEGGAVWEASGILSEVPALGVAGLKESWRVTRCRVCAACSGRLLNLSVKDLSRVIISCRNHGGWNCPDPSFPVVQRPVNRILLSEREVSAAPSAGTEAVAGRGGCDLGESSSTPRSIALCARNAPGVMCLARRGISGWYVPKFGN